MRLVLTALLACVITGCSVTGGVVSTSSSKSEFDDAVYKGQKTVVNEKAVTGETFRLFNQGATGFTSNSANREDALYRAGEFCQRKSKEIRVLTETSSTPPYILGNFPRVEVVFECVQPSAKPATAESKYSTLATLKKLLDDGAITQEEYLREKDKILK